MNIKKGDTVKILYGKERGRRGPVVAVDPKNERIIVEGLNLYKRHLKGDGRTRTSEIVTIEKPFPISKVMLVCPSCDKPTRVGIKQEGDKKVRVCKKCGKEITDGNTVKKESEKKEEKKETKKKATKKETKKKTTKKSTKTKSESKK
jgi:large subunit ribosomal protein L24